MRTVSPEIWKILKPKGFGKGSTDNDFIGGFITSYHIYIHLHPAMIFLASCAAKGLHIKDVLELNAFDGLLGLAFPRDSQDPSLAAEWCGHCGLGCSISWLSWWFGIGTWLVVTGCHEFYFPINLGNVIIPIDSYFSGWGGYTTTNQALVGHSKHQGIFLGKKNGP